MAGTSVAAALCDLLSADCISCRYGTAEGEHIRAVPARNSLTPKASGTALKIKRGKVSLPPFPSQ